jgi:hypothetical protein
LLKILSKIAKPVPEGGGGLSVGVCVLAYYIHENFYHFLLPFVLVINKSFVVGVVDGQIRVDPNFEIAIIIDADLILLNLKVFGVIKYFPIAFQRFHEDVEVIREGDIAYFAEADSHVFNIYASHIAARAHIPFAAFNDELGADHSGLLMPPVERFQIILIFLFVRPYELVLVYFLSAFEVAQRAKQSILLSVVVAVRQVLPVFVLKLRSFNMH